MEATQQYRARLSQLLVWGVIACALFLLPFTSSALVYTYCSTPASMPTAVEQPELTFREEYDAKYHETRCYQVLTARNYEEPQEQWAAPCACTANIAVLAEAEYASLLKTYKSFIPETSAEYLLYDFDFTSRINEAEVVRATLKDRYREIIRKQCWVPYGLDSFWTKTYSKPKPIKRESLPPPGSITIG